MAERSAGRPAPPPSPTPIRRPPWSAAALPAPLTPLVGRERPIASVVALLRRDEVRLVTLTGPGGVGKTRVALAAAHRLGPDFAGVVFIPLAAVRDHALLMPTVAQALGLREAGGRSLAAVLIETLRQHRLLLVLDNLEQLLAAGPGIVDLLTSCPGLKVLATSRAVLRLSGEWAVSVPPLDLPLPRQRTPAELLAVEAVALFVARARAADPAFVLDEITAPAVAEICRRLDGLPLALELAAARLRHLSLAALLDQLERRLPLLTGGPRDQPARLQSVPAAIAWSYDFIGPAEQALFRRLAVFSGGFTIAAATSVCDCGDELAVVESTGALVDSSLVRPAPAALPTRYTMLETIREFGLSRLAADGEEDAIRLRHAEWCIALVDEAWPAFARRAGQEPWLDRLTAEHDNLRAALDWLLATDRVAMALHLAGGLFWFWFVRGHLSEGHHRLDQVLRHPASDAADPVDRARALLGVGFLAHFRGDDGASGPLQEARLLSRETGFAFGEAAASITLGILAEDRGNYEDAAAALAAALAVCRRTGDRVNEALALYHLGVTRWGLGDSGQATALIEEALAIQRAIGDQWGQANSSGYLGLIRAVTGQPDQAAASLRESLRLRRALGTPVDLANVLASFAVLAAAVDEPALAARLVGAEQRLRETVGTPRKLPEGAAFERATAAAEAALGPDAFAALETAGRALALDEALDLALGFTPATRSAPPGRAGPAALTEREREVLALLALGKTNPDIAGELGISPGTVRAHVSNILAKLGAHTRTDAVALARRTGLLA